MTVIDVRDLMPEEIHHLGADLSQCVCDDRDELAQCRSLASVGEDDVVLTGRS